VEAPCSGQCLGDCETASADAVVARSSWKGHVGALVGDLDDEEVAAAAQRDDKVALGIADCVRREFVDYEDRFSGRHIPSRKDGARERPDLAQVCWAGRKRLGGGIAHIVALPLDTEVSLIFAACNPVSGLAS
jgi:hypothetical protein